MDQFVELLTYFVVLSVAAERFTEIIKDSFLEKFNAKRSIYQGIAAGFGGAIAYYAPPPLGSLEVNPWVAVVLTSLAVSGGSGFWNSILSAVNELSKNLKQVKSVKE